MENLIYQLICQIILLYVENQGMILGILMTSVFLIEMYYDFRSGVVPCEEEDNVELNCLEI